MPLPKKRIPARAGYIMAVFRDPRRRIQSAYNYHKHAFGMS
jgi:hypothetical protein